MAAVPSTDTNNDLPIDLMILKKGARVLRAYNHPLRQNMLKLLHRNTQMKVGDIYKKMSIDQSVASAHLGILRQARLVQTTRQGKCIFYSVHYQRLEELNGLVRHLLEQTDNLN
jgi:DNA-binding transcriptional ArsR family regulator